MKPNIIIINPDEMRWDTMGHMGNQAASTPFLDSFASREAVSFRNAYCQNPVCVPSRCSFLTGLYPHVRGHRTMQHLLRDQETSIFKELKEAGYYVWMNSRNDLVAGQITGLAESHGDEIFYYDRTKKAQLIKPAMLGAMQSKPKGDNKFPYSHFEGIMEDTANSDMADTYAAIDRILNPVDERPICLFLGWVNPHPPYGVQEEYRNRIDPNKLPDRVKLCETNGKSRMIHKLNELCGMEEYTEEQWKELRTVYLAQCAKVDDMFKMVCDALKQAGIYDNSAIFFLSDHGDFCGDYDLPEKAQNTFEDCLTKVPLLIKPPKGEGLDAGVTDSLAELVDFYATAMDYAGVEPNHDQFGRSLRPVVENRCASVRSHVFCEGGRMEYEWQCDEYHADGVGGTTKANAYWPKKTAQLDALAHEKGTMVSDGFYKYVHRPSGNCELYNLKADAGERKNLLDAKKEDSDVTLNMQRVLLDWYQQTCDIVPRDYDSRFTEERIFASVRNICPPEKEEVMREYIRKEVPTIMQVIQYAVKLLI